MVLYIKNSAFKIKTIKHFKVVNCFHIDNHSHLLVVLLIHGGEGECSAALLVPAVCNHVILYRKSMIIIISEMPWALKIIIIKFNYQSVNCILLQSIESHEILTYTI